MIWHSFEQTLQPATAPHIIDIYTLLFSIQFDMNYQLVISIYSIDTIVLKLNILKLFFGRGKETQTNMTRIIKNVCWRPLLERNLKTVGYIFW